MKVIFFGTPEFAKHFLEALHEDADISIEAVVTQTDKPTGRKKILPPSPVKIFAAENKIPVFQPEKKGDLLPLFKGELEGVITDIDAFVVVAYGKLIPQTVLDLPKLGTINVHPSKLPQYRGPSPMQAAIVNQDKKTAVSIMLLDADMDHGPILAQQSVLIAKNETLESLQRKAVQCGAPLLAETLKKLDKGLITPQEQDHNTATYCDMLSRDDGRIDWNETAEQIFAKFRAYHPWPGLWTTWNGKRVKFSMVQIEPGTQSPGTVALQDDKITVGTGEGLFVTKKLQIEGQQEASVSDIAKGHSDLNGASFQ